LTGEPLTELFAEANSPLASSSSAIASHQIGAQKLFRNCFSGGATGLMPKIDAKGAHVEIDTYLMLNEH